MQKDRTALTVSPEGVLVVSGYATSLRVERGHLVVRSGTGRDIREGRLSRVARPKLKRLVLIGRGGFLTLESLAWLDGIGARLVHVSRDGRILATSGEFGLDDPRLRRAQALAATNEAGVEVSRFLMRRKLDGQARVLARIDGASDPASAVQEALGHVEAARSLDDVRRTEAEGALAYWTAWANLPVTFGKAHASRVPEHWLRFGKRGSPITGQPRLAANPANALLNYCYALLEAECRIACLAVGLDPGLGIIHADQKARDSLALDLMEAVRPEVDAFVLDLLRTHTFGGKDFHETREGVCRILAPLTHHLAERAPEWARAVAPVAEKVAKMLADGSGKRFSVPTVLTQDRRSAGRDGLRRGPRATVRTTARPLPSACRSCGLVLDTPGRTYCDECLPKDRRGRTAAFSAAGPAGLARLRAQGIDPSQSPKAKRKMGRANARNMREVHAWDREHERPDTEIFVREILPGLQGLPLRRLAAATGLSIQHCGLIRRGLRVPHPRHWDGLRRAAAQGPNTSRVVPSA